MKVLILNPPSKYVKNVVRDLFYGCWCKGKRIASAKFPPTTLMYISAVLKNGGFDVKLLDSQSEDLSYEKVMDITEKYKPDAVVITTSTMTFREDMDALKEVKKRTGAMTLVFGSHVTFKVEDAAKDNDAIDVYVQKEPEHIIRDVIKAVDKGKDWRKVKGIAYKDKIGKDKKGNLKKGKLKINEPYPFIDPLDEMPFPDRDVVSKFEYFNPLVKKLPWTTAITSRGCPGRCNFCNSPVFYGKSIRLRSPENVVDEMEDVVLNGYKEVFYRDETFTVDKKRTLEICRLIKDRGVKISWICSSRINTIDEETIKAMKDAGCHMLRFGVESGVQRILNNIKKGIKVEQTRKVFGLCHKYKMSTHAHVMLGCIGESMETIEKTIKFVKEIDPTTVTFGAFTPYPGTEVFELVKKKAPEIDDGSACDLSRVHSKGYYSHIFSDLSEDEVGVAVRRAYKRFYIRPSFFLKTLLRMRSLDEFRRVVSAGFDVVSYSVGDEE